MNSETKAIGIDLGTTNSLVSIIEKGKSKIIPNNVGDFLTRSCAYLKGDELIVGRAALNERQFDPENFVDSSKRHMGKVDSDGNSLPVLSDYTPEQIAAAILEYLKSCAEDYLGESVSDVVITVPAKYPERAKRAVKWAAERAGFAGIKLAPEPVAAKLAHDPKSDSPCKTAVFDFGGGTFDISIIDFDGTGKFSVLSISGDRDTGGEDIDDAVLSYTVDQAQKQGCPIDLESNLQIAYELKDRCRDAKETLSMSEETNIAVDNREKICKVGLSRDKLTELAKPIIERIEKYCREALDEANLSPDQIDMVLLAGGSSNNFFVPDIIRKIFAQEPRRDVEMDKVVAMGAAIYAAKKFGDDHTPLEVAGKTLLPSQLAVTNICPTDLCIAAMKGDDQREYNSVLIPSGSVLPYSKSFKFTPSHRSASVVNVKLYDGGANDLSENHTPLKSAQLSVQPVETEQKNANRINVTVSMSDEGLVEITAVDTLLNKPVDIELQLGTCTRDGFSSLSKPAS
ncbi:Heat shock protein 70 [Anaerohalosphaera lusitana]|uniref:Heat shock protein 70 n=1 Tax=Anaerohalosphaera lusitana TaxID=1936003 RepID=A0A1U9NLJ8_9BACT|nr:Hsp70 family protein [Anaerohalosphaera lusitana]AQT68705.1 Heat shock protein 70 [Anaerohalosphaera lusitana]